MNYADTILPEFDQEMASTRRVLERIPEDRYDWKAHPKSNTIGWNANHVAELPGWVEGTLTQTSWDLAPPGGEPYQTPEHKTRQELLDFFDTNVARARKAIQEVADSAMDEPWSLLAGGQTLFTMPRRMVIRIFVMNHLIHHRSNICVYLRLNDVPVPALYGPSGDEDGK